ncbi:MAG: response regulator [Deltaproteobacteria bacterium]|nr:response regulator [Deltaproteobacteria bacterium]
MELGSDFAKKNLVEQIVALDELEKAGRAEVIPDLLELYRGGNLDDVVCGALFDTLRALLPRSETDTVAGLASEDPRIQRMCAQTAGRCEFRTAVPTLVALASSDPDTSLLGEFLSTLSQLGAAEAVPLSLRYLRHPDPVVSATAIEMVGKHKDPACVGELYAMVREAEADERYEICDLSTQKAIEAIGYLGTAEAVSFLVSKIHHRNPMVRRLIHDELIRCGARAVGPLGRLVLSGDDDEKVLAANLLGFIGDRSGVGLLLEALDGAVLSTPNARYAAYEALGRLGSLKALVRLADGLDEPDELSLMAVVTALEQEPPPFLAPRLRAALCSGDGQGDRLARTVIAVKAVRLFEAGYGDKEAAARLVAAAAACKDPDAVAAVREKLTEIPGDRAAADAARLEGGDTAWKGRRILAVDDSKSMLFFYRAAMAELGVEVQTAGDGEEALALLSGESSFDLVITDLNMPRMDGIELTRKIRANFLLEGLPILMATTESDGSQVELARKAGTNGFLSKPLTPEVLREAVLRYL